MGEKIATRAAYGKALVELAEKYPDLVVFDADLAGATMTNGFMKAYPDRFFDMGIAEGNMTGVAAGMATCGFKPFINTFAMFAAGRSWEQVRNSICYPGLNVKVIGSHGGLSVGEDGATHQMIEDYAIMRAIPGMMVLTPANFAELSTMLRWAVEAYNGPVAVRYPRGNAEVPAIAAETVFYPGSVLTRCSGQDVTLIGYGTLILELEAAAQLLKEKGIEATVLQLQSVSHYSREQLTASIRGKHVFVIEEICSGSGISGEIALTLRNNGSECVVHPMDLGSSFVPHGSMRSLYELTGIDRISICKSVEKVLGHEN